MSFDKLQPELWSHILEYLAPSLPKPLSGLTKEEAIGETPETIARLPHAGEPGTTTRSDIRSDALAKLMRCSISFNQLASAPLYRTVITDNLKSFTESDPIPAHPLVNSKDELLKHTRSLHIEYEQKGVEPSYALIMSDTRHFIPLGASSSLKLAKEQARAECGELAERLLKLSSRARKGRLALPNLRTLSVGANFGSQEGLWGRVAKSSSVDDAIAGASISLETAFSAFPILHFCLRGCAGPLSFQPSFMWPGPAGEGNPATSPLFTMHFDTNQSHIPAAQGHHTRWLLEQHGDIGTITTVSDFMEKSVRDIQRHRDMARQAPDVPVPADSKLRIAMYGSGNHHLLRSAIPTKPTRWNIDAEGQRSSVKGTRLMRKEREKEEAEAMRGMIDTERDRITWKCSPDSPVCEACHWAFEGEE